MSAVRPLFVCIAGPTATGKTDAAVAVCRALDGEVVSMDSMQIYQGMDIGTAKPSPAEMSGVPHHMLDIVPPDRPYSVAEYQRDALHAAEEILARGKLPVFAGGTGLYLQAVSHPLRFGEAGGAGAVRERLQREAERPGGAAALHARLAQVDAETAARLHPNNVRRVIRALEIYETTGKPMSETARDWDGESAQDWLVFALTWPRDVLYRRIDARVDAMLASGLVEEVRSLLDGGVPREAQAMQAIGYKEIIAALRGETTLDEAVERIKMHSRRYAKRQLTWLRRDARLRWLDLAAFDSPRQAQAEIIEQIQRHIKEREHAGHESV